MLSLLLRLLPAIIVAALGFVAASHPGTRAQWAQLMYLAGSVRRERRQDPKVQRGVRGPFLLIAFLLLAWPISYYRHATRVIEISPTAYGTQSPSFNPYAGQPGAGNAANSAMAGNAATNSAASPSAPAPAAPAAPAPAFNPYGGAPARP